MTTVKVQNKFQKKFNMTPSKKDITVAHGGIVEACYSDVLATELMKFAKNGSFQECIGFACATNHLLLRKAGMQSKLAKVASLTDGTLTEQMGQVYDTYIKEYSEMQINLHFKVRANLTGRWTNITSRQAVRELLAARGAVVLIAFSSLEYELKQQLITKFLFNTLQKKESSTDKEVMKKLDAQALQMLDFEARTRSDATATKSN